MAIRTYKVTLDSKNSIAPEPVFLRQGDKTGAVVIDATLMDNGAPISLDGLTPMFKANTADGQAVIIDSTGFNIIDASAGEFTYQVPNALSAVPGKIMTAYFSFSDTSGSESTFDVAFIIKKAVDTTQAQADDYITIIDGTLQSLQQKIDAMNTDIQTIINAYNQGDFYNKTQTDSKDAATLASAKSYVDSELELMTGDDGNDVDGGIRDYMNTTLSIARSHLDKSLFNVGFGTDYHYDVATNYNPFGSTYTPPDNMQDLWKDGLRKSLNILSLTDTLDAVVFGGDNTDEPAAADVKDERKAMFKEQQDFAMTVFSTTQSPAFILKGNHDNNQNRSDSEHTLANAISDADFAELYRQKDTLYDEKRQNNGNYFYKDFADKKIRLIGLDAYDVPETANADGTLVFNRFKTSGFQQAQIDWLANDALQVPSGYTAIVFLHAPINNTFINGSASGSINHDIVKKILEDYVSGASNMSLTGNDTTVPVSVKYSFNGNKGLLAAVVSGHLHQDGNVIVNGINYVQTRCSLTAGDNVIKDKRWGYYGTALEDAFDLISIDQANRKIKFYRVGAGSEDVNYATRQFDY